MIPKSILDWLDTQDLNDSEREIILNHVNLKCSIKSGDVRYNAEKYLQGQHDLANISRKQLANHLYMSPRTLSRKLEKQNTSYQHLLDNERKRRCFYYLNNGVSSGVELTYLLGFTEASYFYVYFKKITNITFREFKNNWQNSI